MLLLPIPWEGKLKLLVVLDSENVERIMKHDCAEVDMKMLGQHASTRVSTVTIGYANAQEMAQIHKWLQEGNAVEAVKLVTSGFEFRPDLGDHDHGPAPLGGKKN